MLDTTRTEEVIALRSAVRSVAADRVNALPTSPDASGTVPDGALRALADMGLLTPHLLEDGGEGMPNHLEWTVIAEELAQADAGTAVDVIAAAYAAVLVNVCGTPEDRAALLPPARGLPRGTILYFEGFGRSPLELAATAEPADGRVRLEGRKIGVVRATDGAFGVAIIRNGDRLQAAALRAEALDELTVVRDDQAAGKLGARSAATATVDLDGAPADLLDGADELTLHRCVAGYRLAMASVAIGTGTAAVRYAAEYASTREAFGRPIAEYQGVAFPLVDATIALEAAQLDGQALAACLEEITDPAVLATRTGEVVSAASRAATTAAVTAVNTLGGHGYLTDHPVERWYRDAAVLATFDFDPLASDWSATH